MKNIVLGASRAAIAAALFLPAIAQAGTIQGSVTDDSGTRALQSAQLRIVELDRVAEAGRDGRFVFSDVPAGTYTIEVRYVGAETATVTVAVPETGTVAQNFALVGQGATDVLVLGLAANQASSLSRQRAADGVESVLTRDAIGQFPDQNVAESLRRLPGVNILNDQGEGRFVSIRGLDPELNAASVNGVRLPAPESDVRSVALDVISSDVIESIEVKKSLTPDMDADTIGASVEINTTSAFDRKRDLFGVKAEGSYNDLTDTLSPKGSVDFSTRVTDDFGIAGGLSYYNRTFATNNVEMDGWDEDDGLVYADTVEYRDYDVERERISGSLSFDFRASDSTTLYARGLYSQFDDHEYRRRLIFEMEEGPSSGTGNSAGFSSEDEDQEIAVQRDLKDRFERQRIMSLTMGGETVSGPWTLTYSGSWAKSTERENGSIDPVVFERKFENGDDFGVIFDYADEKRPAYSITSGQAAFLDPSEYEFDELERTTLSDAKDEEFALKADVAHKFAMVGGEFTVQAGAKARWRSKSYNAQVDVYDGFEDDLTLADFEGEQDYDLADINPVVSKTSFGSFYNSNSGGFELNPLDTLEKSAESDYGVDEDVIAGYLLGRWDSSTLRVIAGVRVEHTKNKISGNILTFIPEEEDDEGEVIQEEGIDVTTQRFERSYTDWLPSFTVRYEPMRNLVFRVGGSRSLVRPKLSSLAPRALIEDNEGEFGNPQLEPYKSWNLDLSAEYYFSSNGALSAGFFLKDIENYIVEQTVEDVVYNGVTLDEGTTFINGETAKVRGFELSYSQLFDFLPAPLDGLLAQVSYTYTDATGTILTDGDITDPRTIGLPSSSKHTLNAVLGYEKGPISFRAAGTYRDKYVDEVGGAAEEDRWVADHFQLDLSAKYRVTEGIRLFAEWINVTNAPYFAYQDFESRRRLLQYEDYSWTAKFGVSVNF